MNVLRKVLCCLISVCSAGLLAQNTLQLTVDSLQKVIETTSDTTKANGYYQLGRNYIINDSFAKGLNVLEEGIEYGKEIDFDIGVAKMYEYIGIANDINGDLDQAITAYDQSRIYHLKVPNNDRSLNLLDINIGVAYYFAGDLGKSLEYYLKAYEEAVRIDNKLHLGKLVNNIAIIYRRSEKYDEALDYYRKSLAIKIAEDNKDGEATTYQNIGALFSYKGEIDSSLFFLDKAKNLMLSIDALQEDIDYVDYARAEAYYTIDEYAKAYELLQQFEQNNFNALSESVRINGKIVLADLYAKRNNHPKSLSLLNNIETEIGESNYNIELQQVYEQRAKSNTALGRYKNAVNDYSKSAILEDSINSDERLKLESEMQTKYSTLQKEQEIQKLTLEQELQDIKLSQQKIATWLAVGIISLLSFLFWRLSRQKREISSQKEIISKALNEKTVLLKEIHHRVKNNLQVISSLLGIQSRSMKDAKAKSAIQEGRTRVQSMSLIHQNLYKKDNIAGIDMQDYLPKLTNNLLQTYNISEGNIQLKTNIDRIILDVESVVPIGLIVNELISNSLKYAFPNSVDGTIQITLTEGKDHLFLSVSDDGIGLNYDILRVKQDSFGHTLIKAFKSKLNAEIEVSSVNGTEVSLKIKDYKKII